MRETFPIPCITLSDLYSLPWDLSGIGMGEGEKSTKPAIITHEIGDTAPIKLSKSINDYITFQLMEKNKNLSLLKTIFFVDWIQAYNAGEASRPILQYDDLDLLIKKFGFIQSYKGITISPSLIKSEDTEKRKGLRTISAGLLLWLESSESLKEDD